ncbi:MAG TPA: DUF3667 domain-containing protein [Thermoanaerobaculia bacterium]|nr:DUF3667 domain-containing protein [Thermoanaerobaculia bacterium]
MRETEPEPACLNCGEKLLGEFCWRCGQEAADFHRPLRSLASDFLDNVLSLDSKLLRTIRPLLFEPGRLTREYLAGRRAPYVRPLKLYLLAALLSFGVLAIWPETAVKVVVKDTQVEEKADDVVSPPPFGMEGLDFEKALADPKRFGQALTANLQRAFFLLLPVFALLLKLFYLRRGRFYLDHLVFALHFHAFAFVVLTAMVLIEAAGIQPPVLAPVGVAAWLWIFVYLFLALRRVYGGSRLTAGLRFAALLISYGIVFVLALIGLMMLTVYRLQS